MSWSKDDIFSTVGRVLQAHIEECPEVTAQMELVADLGLDSLGVMEIVAELEDEFSLVITEADLRDVATIGDVATAIEGRLDKAGRLVG